MPSKAFRIFLPTVDTMCLISVQCTQKTENNEVASVLGDTMLRKIIVFAGFLVVASTIGAQGLQQRNERVNSLEQATGLSNSPTLLHTKHRKQSGLKTSDGDPHWGKAAGVVIVRSNTDEEGVAFPCIDAAEDVTYGTYDLLQATLQSLVFKPSPSRSSLLEIIWSGQVVVNGAPPPAPGSIDQLAFFMCTVSQDDESVPCSGTAEIPVVAEDMTGAGATEWVNYHGYVEFNPKRELTVEIAILASMDTLVTICGDTITLKY